MCLKREDYTLQHVKTIFGLIFSDIKETENRVRLCSCWKRRASRWKVAGGDFDVLMEEALIFQHLSHYLQIIFMRDF